MLNKTDPEFFLRVFLYAKKIQMSCANYAIR